MVVGKEETELMLSPNGVFSPGTHQQEVLLDEYTKQVRNFLEQRFSTFDKDGIYYAHQPIYGFRKGHCEVGLFNRYIVTYQIMKTLTMLDFGTVLDVGGAEGFKAYVIQELFKKKVVNSDLSTMACKRSKEIFGIPSVSADMHNMPFADDEFDVVVCSESLEHVADMNKALGEILRISRKAAIISVPHEAEKECVTNRDSGELHAHINYFDQLSFQSLIIEGYSVITHRIMSPMARYFAPAVEASYKDPYKYSRWLAPILAIYNTSLPLLRSVVGLHLTSRFIKVDELVCRYLPYYRSLVFVIIKKGYSMNARASRTMAPEDIMSISVPYHYLVPE